MRKSLTSFCKEYGLPKATVYRDCQRLGIDTANGLQDAAIARLKEEYEIADSEPEPPNEVLPADFIQAGQLSPVEVREISLPKGFDASAMVKIFDGAAGQATDTAKLVAIADLALNAVANAMDSKIQQQRERLAQAEQDAKALSEKIAAAQTELKIKALESRLLAERQNSATKSAESLFADLMALGKPAEGADS